MLFTRNTFFKFFFKYVGGPFPRGPHGHEATAQTFLFLILLAHWARSRLVLLTHCLLANLMGYCFAVTSISIDENVLFRIAVMCVDRSLLYRWTLLRNSCWLCCVARLLTTRILTLARLDKAQTILASICCGLVVEHVVQIRNKSQECSLG